MFFAALLFAALPAQAVDLDLTIGVPYQQPVQLTLLDVDEGPVPGVVLPGRDDERYVVDIDLAKADDAWRVSFLVQGMASKRSGRARTWAVAHPTLVVSPDEQGRMVQGMRSASGEADPQNRVMIEVLVRTTDE